MVVDICARFCPLIVISGDEIRDYQNYNFNVHMERMV